MESGGTEVWIIDRNYTPFQSEGSRQDRGPKESGEGVRVDKERLGPDDVNLQTEELHCNYSVLIVSAE